jgi:hypothetical protein
MIPTEVLTSLAPTIATLAVVSAAFVAGGWYFSRRFGLRILALWWLLSSAALTSIGALRTNADTFVLVALATIAAVGFGLAALSLRKRLLASPASALTGRMVLAGVGAFFAGAGLCLVLLLLSDVWQLMRR